jgi:hypothetical protein
MWLRGNNVVIEKNMLKAELLQFATPPPPQKKGEKRKKNSIQNNGHDILYMLPYHADSSTTELQYNILGLATASCGWKASKPTVSFPDDEDRDEP